MPPNPSGNPDSLTAPRFKPGQSGNPGGQPAARNRLTAKFLNALEADFEVYGPEAIEACRQKNPGAYIKAIAALLPKEIELKGPLQDMSDEDLLSGVAALQCLLAANQAAQGDGEAAVGTPTH